MLDSINNTALDNKNLEIIFSRIIAESELNEIKEAYLLTNFSQTNFHDIIKNLDYDSRIREANQKRSSLKLYLFYIKKHREYFSSLETDNKLISFFSELLSYFIPLSNSDLSKNLFEGMEKLVALDTFFQKNEIATMSNYLIYLFPKDVQKLIINESLHNLLFENKKEKKNDLEKKFLFSFNDGCISLMESSKNPFLLFSLINYEMNRYKSFTDSKKKNNQNTDDGFKHFPTGNEYSNSIEEKVKVIFEKKFNVFPNLELNVKFNTDLKCKELIDPIFPSMEIDLVIKDEDTIFILEVKNSSLSNGFQHIYDRYYNSISWAGMQLSNIEDYLSTESGKGDFCKSLGIENLNCKIYFIIVSNHFHFDSNKIFNRYLKTSIFELETIINNNSYLLYDPIFELMDDERNEIYTSENPNPNDFDFFNNLALKRNPELEIKMRDKYTLYDNKLSLRNLYKIIEEQKVWRCLNKFNLFNKDLV